MSHPTSAQWLALEHDTVISKFGGDFSADTFATSQNSDALPVIMAVYNRATDTSRLPWALASLAVASRESGRAVRPLIMINGPTEGAAPTVCEAFGLQPDEHVLQHEPKGKVRAIQAAARQLLAVEGYVGTFATIDDDNIVHPDWPARVVAHMSQTKQDAVSGGTIRYHRVPEVSRVVLGLRNLAVPYRERQMNRRVGLCAHGNNQWFNAGPEMLVYQALQDVDPDTGRGGDAAFVAAVQERGGLTLPMDYDPAGRMLTAGNRSTTITDLVKTALGKGGSRYEDEAWSNMTPFVLGESVLRAASVE